MFKRQPKPRDDDVASRALKELEAKSQDQRDATARFAEGKDAELNEDLDGAITAYLASADSWQKYHITTGHPVPPEPYLRLGVLLRKVKDLDAEISVLESYLAHAGRDPDRRIQERLERVYELAEAADAMDE